MAPRQEWEKGVAPELDYWKNWILNKGYDNLEEFNRMLSPESVFQYSSYLQPGEGPVRALDVGAGPITKIGKVMDGRDVNIRAMDYLAFAYNAILDELNVKPPVRTESGLAERLTDDHPTDYYDVVACSSALDHVRDPIVCIGQMLSVCKPGSYLFLACQKREGERNNYQGFHNWNFDEDDNGRLILWNRYARFDVVEMFRGLTEWDIKYTRNPDTTWIGMTVKKTFVGSTSMHI